MADKNKGKTGAVLIRKDFDTIARVINVEFESCSQEERNTIKRLALRLAYSFEADYTLFDLDEFMRIVIGQSLAPIRTR